MEISRPEILRLIHEFENALGDNNDEKMINHAEASIDAQNKFIKDVNAMVQAVDDKKVANPYLEQHSDLVTLITREIMDPEVGRCLRNIKELGTGQAEAYVQNVIETGQKALSDTIHHKNVYTFQNRPAAELNKG